MFPECKQWVCVTSRSDGLGLMEMGVLQRVTDGCAAMLSRNDLYRNCVAQLLFYLLCFITAASDSSSDC